MCTSDLLLCLVSSTRITSHICPNKNSYRHGSDYAGPAVQHLRKTVKWHLCYTYIMLIKTLIGSPWWFFKNKASYDDLIWPFSFTHWKFLGIFIVTEYTQMLYILWNFSAFFCLLWLRTWQCAHRFMLSHLMAPPPPPIIRYNLNLWILKTIHLAKIRACFCTNHVYR